MKIKRQVEIKICSKFPMITNNEKKTDCKLVVNENKNVLPHWQNVPVLVQEKMAHFSLN
jgi:hypothetical protein